MGRKPYLKNCQPGEGRRKVHGARPERVSWVRVDAKSHMIAVVHKHSRNARKPDWLIVEACVEQGTGIPNRQYGRARKVCFLRK